MKDGTRVYDLQIRAVDYLKDLIHNCDLLQRPVDSFDGLDTLLLLCMMTQTYRNFLEHTHSKEVADELYRKASELAKLMMDEYGESKKGGGL